MDVLSRHSGFPPKNADISVYMERRDHIIKVRLTNSEMAKIRKKMDQTGINTMSAFIRKMAIDGYVVNLDVSGIQETVRLLRICSNNLNQYARRANEGGSIYQGEIRDLQIQLEKIWQTASGTMEALAAIT